MALWARPARTIKKAVAHSIHPQDQGGSAMDGGTLGVMAARRGDKSVLYKQRNGGTHATSN